MNILASSLQRIPNSSVSTIFLELCMSECRCHLCGTLCVCISASRYMREREREIVMILAGGVSPTWAVSPHLDKPPTLASNPISSEGSVCGAPAVIQL